MRLKETDYSRCWMSPYQNKFLSDIQDELPLFKKFNDTKLGKKRIYQWIVMMYDPNSPWRLEEANYWNRKRECALEVGFELEDGYFPEHIQDYLLGKNKGINAMVASFISRFANPEYTQLINLLELQNIITTKMLEGSYDSNITKTLNDITRDINGITNKLFGSGGQDEVLEAKKALYQEAEKSRTMLNPENIAKIMKDEGKLPDEFNPYGGDYEVEKLKYEGDEGEEPYKIQ